MTNPQPPTRTAVVQPPPPRAAVARTLSAAPRAVLGKILFGLGLLALLAPPFLFPDNEFRLGLLSKFMALAILALGVDLIWGYTGMLSLGQGLYFGLGAYAVAYSLELQQVAEDAGKPVGTVPPTFMSYTNLPVTHPEFVPPHALSWIAPLGNIWVALAAAVLVPMVMATLVGLVIFRLRIRGVYFSLITQAMLLTVFTLVDNQQAYTGGRVGIKHLADLTLLGFTFNSYPGHIRELYFLCAGVLIACFLGCALLVGTKFGKILAAIRDNENRVLALGYNTVWYKTFAFAVAGALSGVAGALYVAANQLCGPGYLDIAFSIEAVIFVAVGGRGTLVGAVLGALLVNLGKTYISEAWPNAWTIVLGFLFIGVVLFLPEGLVGMLRRAKNRLGKSPRARELPAT
jgi:urea transport system permease protein